MPDPGMRSARAVALEVIRRVTERGAYSNLTLAAELGRSGLDERDRRLAAELAYGTLRRLRLLDAAIDGAASRPGARVDAEARALLRLGAYQILFTRIPAHAAVSETVGLADERRRGVVNAVLRRIARERPLPPEGPGDEAIAARTGLAPWAVVELGRLLPATEVESAAAALATPASLDLRVNECRTTAEELAARIEAAGYDVRRGRHHPDVLQVPTATPAELPGYREAWFAVQDQASALVAEALQAEPGERILDVCAAPGGKSGSLACAVGDDGLLVASDVRLSRARLVRDSATRLGVPVRTLVQDARSLVRP